MKPKPRYYFIFLCLLIKVYTASPQDIYFNKVLPPEGKTFVHVAGMVQDELGYMWLATKKGLFRYDGYNMISYKNDPSDSTSLSTDALEAICIDRKGMIWLATQGQGIERFDPATRVFTHFRPDPKDSASISSDWISAVLVDHEGILWVGALNGLDRFVAETGKFVHYRNQPADTTSLSNNAVVAIYEDRQNTLWVGTGSVYAGKEDEGGLNRMDRRTGKFTRYLHDPKKQNTLINNKVRSIFEDSKGNFWVGTAGDGLHTMDRISGTFQRHLYDPAHPEKLSRPVFKKKPYNDYITFITEDVSGGIWIGTAESGLNFYDTKTEKVKHYELEKDTAGAFTDRTTWWAYRSKDGVVWISTLWDQGHLYRINPNRRSIPYYTCLDGGVSSFYEEPDGSVWRGTPNGLELQNKHSDHTITRLVNDPHNPASLSDNFVEVIQKDRQENIWVGTHNGLNLLDKNKEHFTRFHHDSHNVNSLSDDFILAIYEDRRSDLWVGTTKGLNRMNRETGKFQRYIFHPADTGTLYLNVVSSVLEDKRGHIWVGCVMIGDVHQLNPGNGDIKTYLKGKGIYCFNEDAAGTIWCGGDEGLFRYNDASDAFLPYTDSNTHTEFSFIRSLIEDEQRNLWLGTSNGIFELSPQRIVSRIYGKSYGVNGNNLVDRSCYKGRNGKLFFGANSGHFVFFPDQLAKYLKPPQIVFNDFRLANMLKKSEPDDLLQDQISHVKKIKLKHNQNGFYFEFAAIDYSSPEDNRHFFMLENYDDGWNKSGSERKAIYYNVPPGKYVFRVKAANSSGIWAEKHIDLIITPPWWSTWWFYAVCIIAASSVIYILFRYRLNQKLKAYELRNTISRDLHDEVGSTLSSIGFLSSMALEDADTNKEKTHNTLNSINQSAHKMLDAMNDIIWNIQPQNDTLDSIVVRMRSFASELLEAKKIALYFNIADNVKHLHLALAVRHDFLLIYKEAVNNLAKYSAASQANISLEFHQPYLILTISDNGKGFDREKIKNGNGLKNMQSRAKKIGAVYHLRTDMGKGTMISLQVKPT